MPNTKPSGKGVEVSKSKIKTEQLRLAGLCQRTLMIMMLGIATACVPWNQGLDGDLSKTPMVCKNGVKYLPYTNASDEAYTSEGRPKVCPKDL